MTSTQPEADERVVFLHIGTLKSGTSYLQSLLMRNQAALERAGVLFPTAGRRWGAQVRAVRDVMGIRGPQPSDGAWDELRASMASSSARRAVVSMEFLSLAPAETVARIVDDLQPARVEVVLGVRDLVRVLPSAWQSMIKQGHPWSFDAYCASVMAEEPEDPEPHRRFWRHHDVEQILDAWGTAVDPSRIHLLTVPPSGASPTLLWERFASIIGVEPGDFDASQDQGSNFSLSYSDSELMRQVSARLRPQLDRNEFKRWATRFFANHVLRADNPDQAKDDKPRLTREVHDWAVRASTAQADRLRERPVQVAGDLADLVPAGRAPDPDAPPAGPGVVYPDRAIDMIAALVLRLAKESERVETGADTEPDDDDAIGGGDGERGRGGRRRARRRARDAARQDDRRQQTADDEDDDLDLG